MIPQPYQAYFVLLVISATFYITYKEIARPSLIFLMAILCFVITGILSPKELLDGFSNPSIASIILLILLTAGVRKNFNIEYLFDKLFRTAKSYRSFLLRMMVKVTAISAFMNNTPVVAAMTPYVFNWGKKNNISPSKLLMPLSFATICGGMITLIGTSTTLVLNGFLNDLNLSPLNTSYLFIIGISVSCTFILFILTAGHELLPNHNDLLEKFKKNKREYLVETQLAPTSRLIDRNVKEGGLRNLKGIYLVEILRENRVIYPVEPIEVLKKEDTLIFAGNTNDIVDLVKPETGIMLPEPAMFTDNNDKINVAEVVISNNSSLIGKKIKDTDFRNRYDAAIVAVHRNGEKLSGKIGELKISAGDLLLVYAGANFQDRVDLYRDVYTISNLHEIIKPSKKKMMWLAALGLLAVIFLISGYFSLFTSLLIIFTIMTGLGMINLHDIKRELDVNMVAILVLSLAMGQATIQSGAAELMSEFVLSSLQPHGRIAILCGLLLFTTVLTSFISNVGAVAIAFPLAYSMSSEMQIDGAPLYLAVAFAASAAFITPIGYQTNLIIYGPGGYTFRDFFRVGVPVTLVYLTTTLICLLIIYMEVFL